MNRYSKWFVGVMALLSLTLQSCLDFDTTGDEFSATQKNTNKVSRRGKVDSLNYRTKFTGEDVKRAANKMSDVIAAGLSAQYAMRGGKEGKKPVTHAYQYQYGLGADLYAQYGVIPHTNFPYSKVTITSAYNISDRFYGGAMGSFNEVSTQMVPLLNHESIDTIPELKAIYLLLYNYSAVEVANVYGPFPYQDIKTNAQTAPFEYQSLETIYNKAVDNIDSIVACLNYYETKPEEYKEALRDILKQNMHVTGDYKTGFSNLNTFVRFANSLKLRMAMHIVKVNPTLAKRWAEEAVKGGVIEEYSQEVCINTAAEGIAHPLLEASQSWHDTRITASWVSILKSLNHPYLKYLFLKNDADIVNAKTKEVTPANTDVIGIRSGVTPGEGQDYAGNQFIAFSAINPEAAHSMPLYLMKLSEVCFLRAEGALRGWSMGGTAKEFYEKGILAGSCEDREQFYTDANNQNPYDAGMAEYMQQESATPYTYKDPTGESEPIESLTKIGVKWNEDDSKEVKLEKIITQKYIAGYPESFEAWVDLRRTGYPRLFDVLQADEADGSLNDGDIIRRLPFPGRTDPATQADIKATGLGALGGPDFVGTRLWWDVKGTPNF